MMRGRPKSAENLAMRIVKRAHHFSKKFPYFERGKIERGDTNFNGRKLLKLELVNTVLPDREISKIFAKAILANLPTTTLWKPIAEYALRKFGLKNKERAIEYLDSTGNFVSALTDHAKKTAKEYSDAKNHLSFAERKILYSNIHHVLVNELGTILFVFERAKTAIKNDKIKLVSWRERNPKK